METSSEIKTIELDQQTLKSLNSTRKWTMFLAVFGFIFCGIMIVFGLMTGAFITIFRAEDKILGMTELSTVILFLVMAIAYFFHVLFMFRFSNHTAKAVQTFDKKELHKAIRNLKFCFMFLGVLIIIALILYFAILIASGSAITLPKEL
jgi:energy-coupling factor transporter transmembrane protein EcfT